VIGVISDVNHFFLDTEIRPTIYVPFRQFPLRSMNVLVKTSGGARGAAPAVRAAISALDRSQPAYGLVSLQQLFDDLSGGVRVIANLIGIFAALALALAGAGIYAVMHYSVSQRTQEIGIRMALGARPSDVGKLVLGNSLQLAGVAMGVGLPIAGILSRAMTAVLSGVVVLEPALLAAATLLVIGTALLASYLPARRAARVDPLEAMRS
jgi:ABC-type antimicrobial peptide transport system permease subunit